MPTAHVRLKPIQWFQEIGHSKQGGEGRYLRATCTYSDDYNVRLSTGGKLGAFLADLSIMDEEPQNADSKPLEYGLSGQQMASFGADSCFSSGHGAWLTPLWKWNAPSSARRTVGLVIRPRSSSMKNACLLEDKTRKTACNVRS